MVIMKKNSNVEVHCDCMVSQQLGTWNYDSNTTGFDLLNKNGLMCVFDHLKPVDLGPCREIYDLFMNKK